MFLCKTKTLCCSLHILQVVGTNRLTVSPIYLIIFNAFSQTKFKNKKNIVSNRYEQDQIINKELTINKERILIYSFTDFEIKVFGLHHNMAL